MTEDGLDEGTVAIASQRLLVGGGAPLASNDPWRAHTISFVASEGGSLRAEFLGFSHDGVGPLLDNVSLSVTGGVPEPATWALMMVGLGGAGAVLRRRAPSLALA